MNKIVRLWGYFKEYKAAIFWSVFASLLVSISNGASAYIVKPALDEIFIKKDESKLYLIVGLIVGIYLMKGVGRFFQNYLMSITSQKVIKKLRDELYEKIIDLPVTFFNESSTGMLMSRITYDVGLIQSSVPAFISLIREAFSIIGLAFVVLYQDWQLGLIALIVLPVFVTPIVKLGKKIKKYSKKSQETIGDISSMLKETITGIKVIKSFTNEEKEKERFKKNNSTFLSQQIKATFYNELGSPIMELLGSFIIASVVIYGGIQVIEGKSTPGTFFSFLAAIALMYDPFKRINSSNSTIQAAIGASERVFEIIDQYEVQKCPEGNLICDARGKDISFEKVYFKYNQSDNYVLKDISFVINPGETVALVGPSGSGKTTIANLLPRFYDVSEGAIKIGGIDIRDFTLRSLRGNIAMVSQDIFLFNDSIIYNICYGSDEIDMERVVEAARAAYAHDFIIEMHDGYNTRIGEMGVRLSGGQKQRIAIARAIYKNPPILILDEATSALDTEAEKTVQAALDNLMLGKTSLVIAHRLSTIKNADKIIVMNNGSIESIGTHKELLDVSPLYKKLYSVHFGM
ncbi:MULTISPECIES: ABC transporter ATP-binding protein [Calditerrivibrio]|uniref:ABC transporter ATP-binding protein n=1 Tax=Calditerrivibrio TaxID=545865 RepID=UPI003C72769A